MQFRNRCVVLSLIAVALCTLPVSAQQPTSGPAKSASCLIRIRFEGRAAPLDPDALTFVANSQSVFDAALNTVAGRPMTRTAYSSARFECTALPRVEDAAEAEGKLTVYVSETDAAAIDESKLLEAVIANLRTALAQPLKDEHRRLDIRREVARKRLEDLAMHRERLREEQSSLLQQAGAPVSPLELEKTLINLQDKRREMELVLTGQRARQDAIAKAIAELTARVEQRAASDPVVAELQQVVEIRQRMLERTRARVASSTITPQEADESTESAALARADLARARASAALNAGGEQIAKLSGDLMQVSIDAAEIRARAELLVKQVEELRAGPAMKHAFQYDRIAAQLRDVESALGAAAERVAQFEQQASLLEPPSVTIIGR